MTQTRGAVASRTVRTPWLRACWPLLAALLVFTGVATPGRAAAAIEYSEPRRAAGLGAPLHILATPRLQVAPAAAIPPPRDSDPRADKPVYGPAPPSHPQDTLRHAYEATGPPRA